MFQAFILAVALCVDSLVVSTANAFRSKMTYRQGVRLAIVFAVFQGGFPFLGASLGIAFKDMVAAVDHWVAFGLLLIVGGKMIVDAIRDVPDEKQLDTTRLGVLCLLGIATSIDAFVVGIGLGLDSDWSHVLFDVVVIGIVTFFASMLGVYLGKRNIPIPERIAGIIAGLVLIGLGTHTLIEHLM